MNVIWLHERAAAKRKAEDAARSGSSEAISLALRYLKEEADDLGESYLSHQLDMAAFDVDPLKSEGQFFSPEDEAEAVRLTGIVNCLESLEGEADRTGDGVMTEIIRCARETAEMRNRTS